MRKLLTTAIRRREIKNITKSVNHVEVANNKIEPSKRDIGSTESSIDDGGGGGIDSSGNYEDNFSAFQLNDIKLLSESAQEVKSKVHDVNKNFLPTLIREQTEGAWRAPAVTHLGLDYHPCTEEYTVGL